MDFSGNSNTTEDLPEVLGRSPPNGISVIVVGSGIGGLSAARECWRIGCDVRVFERQPHEVLTGDSFAIGPSATGSMRNYPRLQKDLESASWAPTMTIRNIKGEIMKGPVSMEEVLSPAARNALPGPFRRYSRPKLYSAMLKHLQRVGVPIEHGKEVVDYVEDAAAGKAAVVLKDGSRQDADLVIAADGVHGHSWKLVLGRVVDARPSGDAILRVAYPLRRALEDPFIASEYQALGGGNRPQINAYFGSEIQPVVSWQQDEIQWGIVHKDDGLAKESWGHHPPLEKALEMLEPYKELPDLVRHVVQATPPGVLVDFRIMWRDPQPKWTSDGGRVIQLGDAAHTFHPSSGNGGTQAVEDAISLAKCLSIAGKDDVPWATRVSNLLRFERVSCIQALGIYSQASRTKDGSLPEIGRWIVAHDPERYAAEKYEVALDHLKKGTSFKNTNVPPGMVYQPWTIEGLVAAKERGDVTVLDGDWS